MAWYDKLDPSSAGGAQLAGLFSGLGQLGAGLMQAGQMRPIGQPGPTLADAFGGFGQGRQAGLMSAMQQSQIQKMQARQALFAEAQSDKPDDAISAQARAIRQGLASLPEEARPFVGPDEAGSLLVQRATGRVEPMSPEQKAAMGYRPDDVVYVNPWTGAPSVVKPSDMLSPGAEAQRSRMQAAGRAPPTTWRTIPGPDGQPIAQVSSLGEYRPLIPPQKPPEGFRFRADGGLEVIPGYAEGRSALAAAGQPARGPAPEGMQFVNGELVPIPGYTANKPAVVAAGQPPQKAPEGMRYNARNELENIPGFVPATAEAAAARDGGKAPAAAASELRGEWTKLTGNFRTVQDAFNKINMAGDTGQGDMALLYGYMKLLDPESVVRESEFAMAAKTGSLPEQVQGWATKLINGERLPASVREGFKNEARNVYSAVKASYGHTEKIYRDMALRRGVNPADVVLPFQFEAPTARGGGGQKGGGTSRDPLGLLK